jgi:nucleoid-associated protein YgaU
MFARVAMIVLAGALLWAIFARDTGASGPSERYRVRAGDTLWAIALEHYAGDPREGVWRLEQANELRGSTILPGQVLVLP